MNSVFVFQVKVNSNVADAPPDKMNMFQYWANARTSFNFYEAWFNWRRTGVPALTPVNYINNATNAMIPRRFPYPIAEENTNPENYRAASGAVIGGDLLTGRVWWDSE